MSKDRNKCYAMRLLAMMLCAVLFIQSVPVSVLADLLGEPVPVMLPVRMVDLPEEHTGAAFVYIAAANASVPNTGRYILTVSRSGDVTGEAAVTLNTVDICAAYGVDYVIKDPRFHTRVLSGGAPLIETLAEGYNPPAAENIAEQALPGGNTGSPQSPERSEEQALWGGNPGSPQSPERSEEQALWGGNTVSLAAMRAEKTGKPSRDTGAPTLTGFSGIMDNFGISVPNEEIISSQTRIYFEAGEAEKHIVFETLTSTIPMGDKVLDFFLSEPEGTAQIPESSSCTVTITDDRPFARSVISLASASYANGVITARAARSGAEFSVVTVMVRVVRADGSIAGEPVRAEFAPYTMEQTVTLSVNGAGPFYAEIYEFLGADEGRITQVLCAENKPAQIQAAEPEPNTDPSVTGSINIDGKTYYLDTHPTKKGYAVLKENSDPSASVFGEYVIPTNDWKTFKSGNDPNKALFGGSWDTALGKAGNGHMRWHLYYYSSRLGDQGRANAQTPPFNATGYHYARIDWEQRNTYGGWLYSGADIDEWKTDKWNSSIVVEGKFDRRISEPLYFSQTDRPGGKPLPDNKLRSIKVYAWDRNWATPKVSTEVYGVALMYMTYDISVTQPAKMTYKDPDGVNGKAEIVPAYVTIAESSVGSSNITVPKYGRITFNIFGETYKDNILVRGYLKGYKITVANKASFEWKLKYKEQPALEFDDDLAKKIHDTMIQYDIGIPAAGHGIGINVQPLFEYIEVDVEIGPAEYGQGTFNDTSLTVGAHKYHVGDIINLTPKPESGWSANAYRLIRYFPAGGIARDSLNYTYGTNNETIENSSKYVIRPVFSEAKNVIEIKMTDAAKEHLTIIGLIPDPEQEGRMIIDADPKVGKVYTISAKPKTNNYRAVFTVPGETYKIKGNVLDFTAGSRITDNIITVDAEPINALTNANDNALTKYDIIGTVLYNNVPIRNNNVEPQAYPATYVTAAAGSYIAYDERVTPPKEYIARHTGLTDNSGRFIITGVEGMPGDTITMALSNGLTDYAVKLTLPASSNTVNAGDIFYPMESSTGVVISGLEYAYEKESSKTAFDSKNATVAILQETATFTLHLSYNPAVSSVKRATYYKMDKNRSLVRVASTEIAKGQKTVVTPIYLDTAFMPGDSLYVELLDAEDHKVIYKSVDEHGVESDVVISHEWTYPLRFTGLTFIQPQTEPTRPVFGYASKDMPAIPPIGNLKFEAPTVKLIVHREQGPQTEEDGTPIVNPSYTDYVDFGFNYSSKKPDSRSKLDQLKSKWPTPKPTPAEQAAETIDRNIDNITNNMENEFGMTNDTAATDATPNAASKPFGDKVKVDVGLALGFSFDYKYSEEKRAYVFAGGAYLAGIVVKVGVGFTGNIEGIPVYIQINMEVANDFSGKYKTEAGREILRDSIPEGFNPLETFDNTNAMQIGLGAKIMPGAGVYGILGVRGIIELKSLFHLDIERPDLETGGLATQFDGYYFGMNGGIGVDLLLTSFEIITNIANAKTGVYKTTSNTEPDYYETETTRLRVNNPGSPAWTANSPPLNAGPGEVGYSVLVDNANERTKPKITTLSDGRKLMVYLDNDGSHPFNGQRVMLAVRDTGGVWGAPMEISTPGRAAEQPALFIADNGDIYIAWSESSEVLSAVPNDEDALVTYTANALKTLDIKYRVYSPGKTTPLGDTISLTNEPAGSQFSDTHPIIHFDRAGSPLIAYYIKRDTEEAARFNGTVRERIARLAGPDTTYSTICYKLYENGAWGPEQFLDVNLPGESDPLIIDFSAETLLINGEYTTLYAFTRSPHGNLQFDESRDVYLGAYNIAKRETYGPQNLTGADYHAEVLPRFTKIPHPGGADIMLTWTADGNTFFMMDVSYLDGQENTQGLTINEFFEGIREGDTVYETKVFDMGEGKELNGIGDHEIVRGGDGNYYLFWADTAYDNKTGGFGSRELYGAVYMTDADGENMQKAGLSNAVRLTHFSEEMPGLFLDELDVTVDKNRNMTLVANMFTQEAADNGGVNYSDNRLIAVEFEPVNSLSVNNLSFDAVYPSSDARLYFTAENNGLYPAEGFDTQIYAETGGASVLIEAWDNSERILPGHSYEMSVPVSAFDTDKFVIIISEKGVPGEKRAEIQVPRGAELVITDLIDAGHTADSAELAFTVTNAGNTPSRAFSANVVHIAEEPVNKSIGAIDIPAVEPGESVSVRGTVQIDPADLDNFASMTAALEFPDDIYSERIPFIDITYRRPADIVINSGAEQITIAPGETTQITSAALPSGFFTTPCTYTITDTKIAHITPDGRLTAYTPGITELMAVYPDTGLTKVIPLIVSGDPVIEEWDYADGYWYYYKNGEPVKSEWVQWRGVWYYLGEDGKMYAGKWLRDYEYDGWYYLTAPNGNMLRGAWISCGGYWYYMKNDGKMAYGEWIQWYDNWYYLADDKEDGYMYANDTFTIDGREYTFDENGACINPPF